MAAFSGPVLEFPDNGAAVVSGFEEGASTAAEAKAATGSGAGACSLIFGGSPGLGGGAAPDFTSFAGPGAALNPALISGVDLDLDLNSISGPHRSSGSPLSHWNSEGAAAPFDGVVGGPDALSGPAVLLESAPAFSKIHGGDSSDGGVGSGMEFPAGPLDSGGINGNPHAGQETARAAFSSGV